MSDLAFEAFQRLYPTSSRNLTFSMSFSGKFSDYNANVKKVNNHLSFSLSRKWESVNKEIVIGLLQDLTLRVLRDRKKSMNIDLYNEFIKNLHIAAPKQESDPLLAWTFDRMNNEFFHGLMEAPNMVWGSPTTRQLAHYDYQTDSIIFSEYFRSAPQHILDYLMYHELLHKKHKFKSTGRRTLHHSAAFKKDEAKFPDLKQVERDISSFLRGKPKFSLF